MKKYKVLICVSLAIILALSVCILSKPLAARLYLGDRIKGTVEVVVDGAPFVLSEGNFDVDDGVKLEAGKNGTMNVALRAGDYGDYPLVLTGVFADRPITVHCFQHNWWNIMTFDLKVQIDTEKNEVTYSGSVTTRGADGKKQIDSIEKTQRFTDRTLEVSFGL